MRGLGIRNRGGLAALLVAASLLLPFQSEAQEDISPPPLEIPSEPELTHPTALESYLERPGILLVTRRHPLPAVVLQGGGEMRLEAVAAHEPGMRHQRMMGIRVELDAAGLTHEERVAYIDLHEIEALARAIGFMTSATAAEHSAQGSDRTEMRISTLDGLEVAALFSAGRPRYFLRTPTASFAVGPVSLTALGVALDQAREYLFSN
jgi:hypothetical protein